ncbi:cilia- and flagella-associated protein 107 [Polymixia lowei]
MYSMNKTGRKNEKWNQPGWRIEQKYANKVLIGNWVEERQQFTREPEPTGDSTNRADYRPHWDFKPDVFVRHAALRRAEGLPSKQFFAHHNTPPRHYLVTLYDESYGRKHDSALAARRSWHPDSLTWQPEKSDHPILAPPTNFGLLESKKRRSEKQPPHLPSLSVYRSAYQRHPVGTSCQTRFARAPRALSSHLHAANHRHKDLDLKQRSLLQVPDRRSSLPPPRTQAQTGAG